jgi:hypothetical protein
VAKAESRKGQSQKPGFILKVLPREENCSLKPVPEKTKCGACIHFEQQQGISIWFCQSVNSAKQTPATINS